MKLRPPEYTVLLSGLQASLAGRLTAPLVSLTREPNEYSATFPADIVTCQLANGRRVTIFCKYGPASQGPTGHGHRSGLAYEVQVHREILKPLGCSTPAFLGAHYDKDSAAWWLLLEHIPDARRLSKSRAPLMLTAARWIGAFHRGAQSMTQERRPPFLKVHSASYFGSWARRTSRFADELHGQYPWLEALCTAFESRAVELLSGNITVIHGEYYSKNIITRGASVYPVDWESAAEAPGEIDLATLLEGYDKATTDRCVTAYVRARWPSERDRPANFEQALDRARLYVAFRWLGDRRSWTQEPDNRWRLDHLAAIGQRLGLIAT